LWIFIIFDTRICLNKLNYAYLIIKLQTTFKIEWYIKNWCNKNRLNFITKTYKQFTFNLLNKPIFFLWSCFFNILLYGIELFLQNWFYSQKELNTFTIARKFSKVKAINTSPIFILRYAYVIILRTHKNLLYSLIIVINLWLLKTSRIKLIKKNIDFISIKKRFKFFGFQFLYVKKLSIIKVYPIKAVQEILFERLKFYKSKKFRRHECYLILIKSLINCWSYFYIHLCSKLNFFKICYQIYQIIGYWSLKTKKINFDIIRCHLFNLHKNLTYTYCN